MSHGLMTPHAVTIQIRFFDIAALPFHIHYPRFTALNKEVSWGHFHEGLPSTGVILRRCGSIYRVIILNIYITNPILRRCS